MPTSEAVGRASSYSVPQQHLVIFAVLTENQLRFPSAQAQDPSLAHHATNGAHEGPGSYQPHMGHKHTPAPDIEQLLFDGPPWKLPEGRRTRTSPHFRAHFSGPSGGLQKTSSKNVRNQGQGYVCAPRPLASTMRGPWWPLVVDGRLALMNLTRAKNALPPLVSGIILR